MSSLLVIDIETTPNEEALRAPQEYESFLRSRFNRTDFDFNDRETLRAFGLCPVTGRIACISTVYVPDPQTVSEIHTFSSCRSSEELVLSEFWEHWYSVRCKGTPLVVTWNGKEFDLPFITARSAILQIRPSGMLPMRKWYTDQHVDLYELRKNTAWRGSLDFWLRAYRGTGKDEMLGPRVWEAFEACEYEHISKYCTQDCIDTLTVYNRERGYFF